MRSYTVADVNRQALPKQAYCRTTYGLKLGFSLNFITRAVVKRPCVTLL